MLVEFSPQTSSYWIWGGDRESLLDFRADVCNRGEFSALSREIRIHSRTRNRAGSGRGFPRRLGLPGRWRPGREAVRAPGEGPLRLQGGASGA